MEAIATGVLSAILQALASFPGALLNPAPLIAVQRLFGDNPMWLHAFRLITKLGDAQAAALVILLLLWFRNRRVAYALLVAVALAALTDVVLWNLLSLPRPDDPRIMVREVVTVSSFPSGHTMTAMLLWGTLSSEDELPWIVGALLVGGVMLARLYLGVHFVRDLLGALLIGVAWIVILRNLLWPALVRWCSRRSPRFFLVLGALVCAGALIALPIAPNGRWEIFAAAAGAALALPLEYRFVRFTPTRVSPPWSAAKLLLGLGGAVALIFSARYLGESARPLAVGLVALAALWGILGVPALFARLELATHQPRVGAVTGQAAPF